MTTQPPFPATKLLLNSTLRSIVYKKEYPSPFCTNEYSIGVDDLKAEHDLLLQLLKVAGEALERLVSAVDAYETISDETAAVALYRAQKALEKLKTAGVI